jgi:GNAT superfamily N-acetyltransferase
MLDSTEPPMTRPAVPSDEAFLRDLYACVRWPELAAVPWSEAEKRAFCDMQFTLQDRFYREQYPDTDWLIVVEHGVPVGRLYVTRAADEIKVLDIALLPGARGRGLGTQLMRTVLDEADRAQLRVSLFTEPDNPARRLYARLGFVARHASDMHVELTREPVVPDRVSAMSDATPLTARD